VAALRVILVSDTHLSGRAPEAKANWDAVLRQIDRAPPDIVIHLGDLSLDGAHEPGDLSFARRQLDRLPVPWHAVPGNHDVGDNPRPGAPEGSATDAERRQRWLDLVGPDYWSLAACGWTMLAINAQLAGTGMAAETAQWSWLAEQLGQCSPRRPVALITHKPLTATDAEIAAAPPHRFLPAPARQKITDLAGDDPLALVLSGHVHQHRLLQLDGTDHLWAPATWAVLPDDVQPALGAKRCGIVALEFAGTTQPRPQFIEPAGLAQLTLLRDLPDPYR
jgi:3',5'-cyclic AMP phosphodiesterase CpdA